MTIFTLDYEISYLFTILFLNFVHFTTRAQLFKTNDVVNPYLAFRDNSRAGGGLSTQKPVILTIYHMQPFRASVPIQE